MLEIIFNPCARITKPCARMAKLDCKNTSYQRYDRQYSHVSPANKYWIEYQSFWPTCIDLRLVLTKPYLKTLVHSWRLIQVGLLFTLKSFCSFGVVPCRVLCRKETNTVE